MFWRNESIHESKTNQQKQIEQQIETKLKNYFFLAEDYAFACLEIK